MVRVSLPSQSMVVRSGLHGERGSVGRPLFGRPLLVFLLAFVLSFGGGLTSSLVTQQPASASTQVSVAVMSVPDMTESDGSCNDEVANLERIVAGIQEGGGPSTQ